MLDRRFLLGAVLLSVALWAQSPPARAQGKAVPVAAVATFSILGDFVRQVGGDRVQVTALVGPDGDAHEFQPSPADARKLAEARIVFVNGLGLEGWFDRLIKVSGTKAPVVTASAGVTPISGEGEAHGGPNGGPPGGARTHHDDPHAWQSIANAKLYVGNIRDGLARVDPDGASTYQANAARYLAELDALDGEVRTAISAIPPGRREIITTHDAFGYFAKAYGLTFIAPQGVSTESEASAKDVARIIRQIKARKVPAVFLENISDPRLMEQIARESGARIGGKVYSDALSKPDGPAATYVDMMRNNVRAFRAALGT